MYEHRLCKALSCTFHNLLPPFSCFSFIEKTFGFDSDSIHRCFSLARSFHAQTLILEKLSPEGDGIIAEENAELKKRYPSYRSNFLYRISFWNSIIHSENDPILQSSRNLIGYAIIKNDCIPENKIDKTHVFEAVFRKYSHKHNCIRKQPSFEVRIANGIFKAKGVVFAQQNGLSKCCAHVALYSILANYRTKVEPSFAKMTQIVNGLEKPKLDLSPQEIRKILDSYQVKYHDYLYSPEELNALNSGDLHNKSIIPFNKLVYAGIESGAGALAGFTLPGGGGHIIPFYGHTFNKDTWVPDAEIGYFKAGKIKYSPSENWTSSFIGHDDNFGANLCIPKLYLTHKNVTYVVEIFKRGVCFSGAKAEVIAYQLFYSILRFILEKTDKSINYWTKKTFGFFNSGRIVLRTVALSKKEYLKHLRDMKDWESNQENPEIIQLLTEYLPSHIWLTEFSSPQLFPANERKIGEIIINATHVPDKTNFPEIFVAARFPCYWYFPAAEKHSSLISVPSCFQSHTPNFH